MLIRFNVKNFLSFSHRDDIETNEERSQEFSMIPGKTRSKTEHINKSNTQDLLKFAVVYGANAAGKSNLIKALAFMQKCIIFGKIPLGYTEKFCKTDEHNKNKPSYFELQILLNDKCYSYGFEIVLNTSEIVSEWLVEIQQNDVEKLLFERNTQSGAYEFSYKLKSVNNLSVYANDIKNDKTTLFLSIMNQNKNTFYNENKEAIIFKKIFEWISISLNINYPDSPISDGTYLQDVKNIEKLGQFLCAFDTGIKEVKAVEITLEKMLSTIPPNFQNNVLHSIELQKREVQNERVLGMSALIRSRNQIYTIKVDKNQNIIIHEIQFSHKDKFSFSLGEESDGTARLFDLIEILAAKENKTYVIDELDRCLHPSLTYEFVKTFLEVAKQCNIQLIVTAHESRLLDFDLLRRDEVWFINKNDSGESDMYSLEEYNERFDKKIDKAYLEGRYGGTPVFSTLFPIE